MWSIILQILFGVLFANLIEYLIHKYILHGLGKKKGSFFSFHWSRHHNLARKHNMYDKDYAEDWWHKYRRREHLSVLFLTSFVFGIVKTCGFEAMAWTFAAYGMAYLIMHSLVHSAPGASKWLPWHFSHHMGANQDANWGVVLPIFDYILGTRIK